MEAALRDWLFGSNPWGISMIVGYPEDGDTPVDPHSVLSAVYKMKIDGGLVDGPVYASIFNQLRGLRMVNDDEYIEFQSELCVYHDDYGDYSTNEPTMDGTASLCYYLSALDVRKKSSLDPGFVSHYGGIVRGDTSSKVIHLAFSGADYSDGGEHIRKTLKKHKIMAHFFFTGDLYRSRANKKLIEELRDDGHSLGAHSDKHLLYASWDHRDSLLTTHEEFIEDLRNNYKVMEKFGITKKDSRLFMPPYEWYNETISQWVRELGLILINFTPGTRSNADYTTPDMGEKYVSSDRIYHEILNYERHSHSGLNGFILLIHIGTHPDRSDKFYHKLEDLISELRKRGYRFTLLNLS
jgi:peptidoglycan/xylan/chitin deacetylase (PgdA/CDA1 family)